MGLEDIAKVIVSSSTLLELTTTSTEITKVVINRPGPPGADGQDGGGSIEQVTQVVADGGMINTDTTRAYCTGATVVLPDPATYVGGMLIIESVTGEDVTITTATGEINGRSSYVLPANCGVTLNPLSYEIFGGSGISWGASVASLPQVHGYSDGDVLTVKGDGTSIGWSAPGERGATVGNELDGGYTYDLVNGIFGNTQVPLEAPEGLTLPNVILKMPDGTYDGKFVGARWEIDIPNDGRYLLGFRVKLKDLTPSVLSTGVVVAVENANASDFWGGTTLNEFGRFDFGGYIGQSNKTISVPFQSSDDFVDFAFAFTDPHSVTNGSHIYNVTVCVSEQSIAYPGAVVPSPSAPQVTVESITPVFAGTNDWAQITDYLKNDASFTPNDGNPLADDNVLGVAAALNWLSTQSATGSEPEVYQYVTNEGDISSATTVAVCQGPNVTLPFADNQSHDVRIINDYDGALIVGLSSGDGFREGDITRVVRRNSSVIASPFDGVTWNVVYFVPSGHQHSQYQALLLDSSMNPYWGDIPDSGPAPSMLQSDRYTTEYVDALLPTDGVLRTAHPTNFRNGVIDLYDPSDAPGAVHIIQTSGQVPSMPTFLRSVSSNIIPMGKYDPLDIYVIEGINRKILIYSNGYDWQVLADSQAESLAPEVGMVRKTVQAPKHFIKSATLEGTAPIAFPTSDSFTTGVWPSEFVTGIFGGLEQCDPALGSFDRAFRVKAPTGSGSGPYYFSSVTVDIAYASPVNIEVALVETYGNTTIATGSRTGGGAVTLDFASQRSYDYMYLEVRLYHASADMNAGVGSVVWTATVPGEIGSEWVPEGVTQFVPNGEAINPETTLAICTGATATMPALADMTHRLSISSATADLILTAAGSDLFAGSTTETVIAVGQSAEFSVVDTTALGGPGPQWGLAYQPSVNSSFTDGQVYTITPNGPTWAVPVTDVTEFVADQATITSGSTRALCTGNEVTLPSAADYVNKKLRLGPVNAVALTVSFAGTDVGLNTMDQTPIIVPSNQVYSLVAVEGTPFGAAGTYVWVPLFDGWGTAIDGDTGKVLTKRADGSVQLDDLPAIPDVSGYGDIVTHDASEFASSAQGSTADTAVQPGDLPTFGDIVTHDAADFDVAGTAAGLLAATDFQVFRGPINCSANPNYPAAEAGETYRVTVAGKIGGASGPNVEVGDSIICTADGTVAGTHAAVGASWFILQANLDGTAIGAASSTAGNLVVFADTTGKTLADGGTISNAVNLAVQRPIDYCVCPYGTSLTTGDGKPTTGNAAFQVPSTLNGMNLIGVAMSCQVTSSSGIPTFQIARGRQGGTPTVAHDYVDMLSTKLTIDAGEYRSSTATTAAVIDTSNDDLLTGDLIRFDCDVAGTGCQGVFITLTFGA